MIKYLVLDLDDTIYPEIDYVFSGYKAVIEYITHNYRKKIKTRGKKDDLKNQLFTSLKKSYYSGDHCDFITYLLEHFNLSENKSKELINIYRFHKPNIKPYKDFIIFLNNPKVREICKNENNTILITDGIHKQQAIKINVLMQKIPGTFKCKLIVNGENNFKPHSSSYGCMFEFFNTNNPEEILCIGDNPHKDFFTPNKLGCKTVRILRDENIYKDVEYRINNLDYNAQYTFNNFSEVEYKFFPRIIKS